MSTHVIDQRARDEAREAKYLITAHTDVCEEQNKHIIRMLGDIGARVDGLYTRFWVGACGLIVAMGGILGKMVFFPT